MLDIKTYNKLSRSKRKNLGRTSTRIPRMPAPNEMVLKTAWSHAALSSGTAGTLSDYIAPSIVSTNEYSTIGSLFTEVKLLACQIHLTSRNPYATGTTSTTVTCGTRYDVNSSTASAPTTIDNVINSTHVVDFTTASNLVFRYSMAIPGALEFAVLAADAPNPATPWAGSPGAVLFYGTGMANSTSYFDVRVYAAYHLRGRN